MKKINHNNELEKIGIDNIRDKTLSPNNQNKRVSQKNCHHSLLNQIIAVIEEKKYYMLVPEKSKIAKFIVENVMEIYDILKSNVEGY